MPRSDAVPIDQSAAPTTQQQPSTLTGRAAAVPLDQPAAPTTSTAAPVPLFSLTGPDKIGEFFSKAGDTATFGLAAKAQDALGFAQGPHGETVAQQVKNAGKDIGPVASAGADLLGYAAGPGELRVGEGLGKLAGSWLARGVGENVASRVGGRMIGSGIEGTGATILGAAGHDQDLTMGDLLKSALISTATGALPGGAGERPTTPSTADLEAIKNAAFAPLKTTPVNASAVDAAVNGISRRSGAQVNLSDAFKGKADEIGNEVAGKTSGLTAEDVADYQRALWGKTRNGFDQAAAGQYGAALDNVVGPSLAYDIKNANAAHNTFKTSGEIDNWLTNPSTAPGAVASRLAKKPDFYKSQPGLFDALSAVGDQAKPPPLWMKARNYAADAAARSAIGAGGAYLFGQNPYVGAATGFGSKVLLPHAADSIAQGPVTRGLLAAQHLNATGMKVDPSVYTSMGLQIPGILARQAGYGAGAAGAF
jgi:hypothetical protein